MAPSDDNVSSFKTTVRAYDNRTFWSQRIRLSEFCCLIMWIGQKSKLSGYHYGVAKPPLLLQMATVNVADMCTQQKKEPFLNQLAHVILVHNWFRSTSTCFHVYSLEYTCSACCHEFDMSELYWSELIWFHWHVSSRDIVCWDHYNIAINGDCKCSWHVQHIKERVPPVATGVSVTVTQTNQNILDWSIPIPDGNKKGAISGTH